MAYSDKVLDHYTNPRNVGSLDKSSSEVGTGLVGAPECGDVMKLQIKVNPDDQHHRGRQVQDLWLRLGDRVVFAGDRVGEGQDRGRSAGHQEHRHREGAFAASGEDPLLGAGGRCHSRRHRRLEEEERRRRRPRRTPLP